MLLITAPARYGKTVIMDTIFHFTEKKVKEDGIPFAKPDVKDTEFYETKIADHHNVIADHFKNYFIIRLDLSGNPHSFQEAVEILKFSVYDTFRYHHYLRRSAKLDRVDKDLFDECFSSKRMQSLSIDHFARKLQDLNELLLKHHGAESEFIILIDGFDSLITNSMFSVEADDLKKIADLRDTLIGNFFKHNQNVNSIKVAILTGIAGIVCSASSPLNNRKIDPVHAG